MRSLFRAVLALALAPVIGHTLRAEEKPAEAEIIVIHPIATTETKQGLPNFVGISGKNAGTRHISMNKVIIPPGKSAKAHIHKGYESVVYIIKGRVKTLYGEGLKKSVINEAGDFLYRRPAAQADQPERHGGGRGDRRPHRSQRTGERRADRRARRRGEEVSG